MLDLRRLASESSRGRRGRSATTTLVRFPTMRSSNGNRSRRTQDHQQSKSAHRSGHRHLSFDLGRQLPSTVRDSLCHRGPGWCLLLPYGPRIPRPIDITHQVPDPAQAGRHKRVGAPDALAPAVLPAIETRFCPPATIFKAGSPRDSQCGKFMCTNTCVFFSVSSTTITTRPT